MVAQMLLFSGSRYLQRVPVRRAVTLAVRYGYNRLLQTPVAALAPQYPISSATLHLQCTSFSTKSTTSKSPTKKKPGLMAKFKRTLRTLFGTDDDTPRGIQERKELFWIVLAVAHHRLRTENQRYLAQQTSSFIWQSESRERLKQLMDEAVSYLDAKTDITHMSLRRLRNEVQSFLGPQIVHLLTVAHDVEAEMIVEDEEYVFGEEEEQKYKEIILHEYEHVCRSLNDSKSSIEADKKITRTPDPLPYYEIKKGAIETLLTHFEWWPQHSSATNYTTTDVTEFVDDFGFSPIKADSDVVHAMRYYHARNMARSFLARRATDKFVIGTDDAASGNSQQPRCYHTLLPLKSTIPSAGRGLFVDGFAPAGTLLTFIPGNVWTKDHLQSASPHTQMQLSNDPRHQLSMRCDDILIDSRFSPYTVVKNLWALGHIVNHPPAPTASASSITSNSDKKTGEDKSDDIIHHHQFQGPNCVTVMINFTDRMLAGDGAKLRDYLPNEYELPPKPYVKNVFETDDVIMHGMGLIASRDVRDEELFYDYRLSPDKEHKMGHPSWYYLWDEDAVNNRWDTDDDYK